MKRQSAFTLIELLAVIVILAVISVGISSRFSDRSSFQALATRDDIVAGLFYAQQVAMARGGTGNQVRFISSGNSIDIQESGASVANDPYPLALPGGFNLADATLNYDKLGRTAATTLTLSGGGNTINIQVSATGYAR